MIKETIVDDLSVRIYEDKLLMGADAAKMAGLQIRKLLKEKENVNIIFAAAPSQKEFLDGLVKEKNIPWERVNAFHMDEYVGLAEDWPQRFGNFLKEAIFERVPFHEVHYLNGMAVSLPEECERYAALLVRYPPDIVCMGIGENAHIAFNDPHVADFDDPELVKVVDLDSACKLQQVNDGCFENVEEVPSFALSLTIPALMRASAVICTVPGSFKAEAVYHTLRDHISEKYPSTILRRHPNTILFLDKDSARLLSSTQENQRL